MVVDQIFLQPTLVCGIVLGIEFIWKRPLIFLSSVRSLPLTFRMQEFEELYEEVKSLVSAFCIS